MLMSTQPAGRISQFLPTVKCSNCSLPVPLAELGDHVCAPPPPLPAPKATLNIPKPALSPGAAASLLPQRLQGLVVNPPSVSHNPPPTGSRIERPSVNTNPPTLSKSPFPTRPSPLARTGTDPPAVRSPSRDPYASGGDSPVRSRPPVAGFARARSASSASHQSPITARPSFLSVREMPPPPPPPITVDERSVNTQSGGEAGMAGVGRRGFAAAARAAMFAAVPAPAPSPARANPPRNIDIGAANFAGKTTTPPLSTSTCSSGSPGVAPFPDSPRSDVFNGPRSPPRMSKAQPQSLGSASSGGRPSIESVSQSSASEYGLAYADSTDYEGYEDDNDDELRRVNEVRTGLGSYRTKSSPPPLPLSDSASVRSSSMRSISDKRTKSKASLSYESDGSDYGDLDVKRSDSSRIAPAFGLSQLPSSPSAWRGGPGTPSTHDAHRRGSSSGSARSDHSRSAPNATPLGDANRSVKGQLERETDKMAQGTERSTLYQRKSTGGSKATVDMDNAIRRRTPSPEVRTARYDESKRDRVVRKTKVCVRCERKIEDGKWVRVDGGGVLCEKCWKNMYLPKCRRCNLPIEKQAVSSSDGQLKGKYHRECFNCHVCHKPFPDKTFYVLDHKPLCAYHYHEANDSLCAAALCGQPIEGPCAVSHAGDRYHPEHMLCEYPGGCKERLEEYWEVDGRMLCERHSRSSRLEEEEADIRGWAPSSRAMKRTTRYIDLGRQ